VNLHRSLLVVLLLAGCHRAPVRRIVLVPIGAVPADVLVHVQREVHAILHRDVAIAAPIPLPAAAFDAKRKQYVGRGLLNELGRHDVAGADRVVGIIDADAYAPGLNFIFGQADLPGRFAVVALPRLHDSFRGRPENAERFRSRLVKETIHELGHTFGFEHCDDRRCVMHFSNSFGDTDYKTAAFCPRHRLPP
jgi:archaemetzincin